MAENETDTTEVQPEPPRAKLSLMQILLVLGLVVVTQVGVNFAMESLRPAALPLDASGADEALAADEPADEAVDVQSLEPANYLPLDPALVVNLKSGDGSRFLQTTVQLMTRDKDVYDAARTHSPAIRSELIMLLGTVDLDTVASREGKERLQEQAREVADQVLMELAGVNGIDALYLTSFVVQ